MKRTIEGGFSLIELAVSLAVIGLLFPLLGQIFYQVLVIAPKQSDKTQAQHELAQASLWLTRDGQSAETFAPLGSPDYGQFTWIDYTGTTARQFKTTYSLSATNLVRTLVVDNVTISTFVIATNIAIYSDVSITWTPSARTVQVDIEVSPQGVGSTEATPYSATIVAFLRPRKEPIVAAPQDEPVPPPPPGSETYDVDTTPTVLTGTYGSGSNTSLATADASFYVVDSTVSGPTKVASWEAVSQTINAPTTISQIEVRYTGQVDRNNTALQFYVKTTGGVYPGSPDSGFTFTSTDTNKAHSIFLSSDQVAYINNVRVITLKLQSSNSSSFELRSDELLFIVSP